MSIYQLTYRYPRGPGVTASTTTRQLSSAVLDRHGFTVLGVRVDATTPDAAIRSVREWVAGRDKAYMVFCTASSVLCALDDADLAGAMAGASLVTPDGMPLVWLGKKRSDREVERVYGPDFMTALIAATGSDLRHFFYGGSPGAAEEMVGALKRRWPDLEVAGTLAPETIDGRAFMQADVDAINAARPDVVWIGLGHPKQELWMQTHRDALDAPVLAGVGAAFDFLSGRKREAPQWMKRSGLQWLHRLASEPRRLWRRYVLGNARFVSLLVAEGIRSRFR